MGIQIKKFQAATLQKAIEQVRSEMGDNAIILQTEPVRGNKALGLFGREMIEVTAAIDRKELAPRFHATVTDKGETATTTSTKTTATTDSKNTGWKALLGLDRKALKKAQAEFIPLNPATTSKATKALAAYAAPTTDDEGTKPSVSASQIYAMKTFIEPLQKEVETLKAKISKTETTPSTMTTPAKKRIKDPLEHEVQMLRSQLSAFINEKRFEGQNLPSYFKQILNFWNDKGMTNRQIFNFFKAMENWGSEFNASTSMIHASQTLTTALDGNIAEANVFEKREKRIVVLVGPTGVGKTTTMAKLAAHEKLKLKKSVTLLTMDDYKIGGTDQLNHYARILEVPFTKTRSDMTLEDQCKIDTSDTLFIDTFGVAASDTQKIEGLKKSLIFKDPELAKRLEIHLVLPVGIAPADVSDALAQFATLNPAYLIFTKWDETQNWGGMLTTILESRKPVSFVCNGQNVPDDVSRFSKKKFIETITEVYTD
ncbi:MAG: flagellar biosynthesis protein FlhF [Deltaproteobacteria bacterium]|nr:flagellar biosynthesis protein FlhF [Deltaproteobacteria bacterium]